MMGLFQPGLPMIRGWVDALLSKGGTMTLPPQTPPGATTPPPMVTVPNKPVTITRPNGILRDPVVLTMIAGMVLYPFLDRIWPDSWGEFPFTVDDVKGWVVGAVPFVAGIVARIKSKNTTRG